MTNTNSGAISNFLSGDGSGTWQEVVRTVRDDILCNALFENLDFETGNLGDVARQFDNPQFREQLCRENSDLTGTLSNALYNKRSAINSWFPTVSRTEQDGRALRNECDAAVADALAFVATTDLLRENPLPGLWNALAQRIVVDLDSRISVGDLEEWQIHNRDLFAGFFSTCLSETARAVANIIATTCLGGANQLRGNYVRLVERIGPDGIRDRTPLITLMPSPVSFGNRSISPLLGVTEELGNRMSAGNPGLIETHCVTGNPANIPSHLHGKVDQAMVQEARRRMYRYYDQGLLAHMGLSALEQLLRCWASSAGHNHFRGGTPLRIENIIRQQGTGVFPEGLRAKIFTIISTNGLNLRNRIMHGGLLEADQMRLPMVTELLGSAITPLIPTDNPYSPENITSIIFDCLAEVDAVLPALNSRYASWASHLFPGAQTINQYSEAYSDSVFAQQDGDELRVLLGEYVSHVAPSASQYFKFGHLGWISQAFSPKESLLSFASLVLTYEIVFRNTVLLLGGSILQITPHRGGHNIQYQILDSRDGQLFNPANQLRILETIPVECRQSALEYLQMGIRTRNAFSHGAIQTFGDDEKAALGHLLLKAIHVLVHAGTHHMVRENAYYRWMNRNHFTHGCDLQDWRSSFLEICTAIYSGDYFLEYSG